MNKMKSPRPPTALHPAHAIAKAKRKKRPTGEDYCNRRRTYGFRRFSLFGFASLVFICSVLFLNSDRSRHPRHTFGLFRIFGVCAPFQICFTQLPILHVYHWSEDERRPAGPVTSQCHCHDSPQGVSHDSSGLFLHSPPFRPSAVHALPLFECDRTGSRSSHPSSIHDQ